MKGYTLISSKTQGIVHHVKPLPEVKNQLPIDHMLLAINDRVTYQTFLGFGGAFTEAAAYTLNYLSQEQQENVIKDYFDPEKGLGYTFGRTSIHSCDFSLGHYTYIEEGDKTLATFDVSREEQYVIPMIKKAMKYAPNLKLMASPWSPPAFMKTNNQMAHGGSLLPEYRQTWANYFSKYLTEMQKRGLPYFAVSVQNEPAAVQVWDSCIYTAEEERDFVKMHLGPTLKNDHPNVKIVIWDHNRDILIERASVVLDDEEARQYVYGVGNHWYVSEAFENLSMVKNLYPDIHMIFTEGCQEGGPHFGAWHTGERYGRNIIGDLNNYLEAFIDWNLVLDETGGPNHVGNLCDAPIMINRDTLEVTKNSSYYYIGHFSKVIRPGAVRVEHALSPKAHVYATTFKNVDGSIAAVIQNESDQEETLTVAYKNHYYTLTLDAHSIVSVVLHD